ncbi:MAG: 50S ribosomal protein L25/general stress protein Ctc [Desulfobacterales bacterium]|uniref:Large ribosomal subunit protein bL25 n=1 Tax=Candidatus Desulfaltia bathyphila TaxID=2841697 RepID=A0A8J6N709_9BACT|nr:50S ribosomal protein L25/general stress protein Ctc [Candidatus Desulfaltia bathyphila]MBL7195437.1 50S ribosomal protein L25/general stress protein Ctc [Desulfobacterales bacterium]MBL7207033.1 50S ribosomal protein L25/general stress protein Ctc [Desulfobacterales bacterium]
MELIELKTNIRTSVGNSQARALRRKKQIPAVLYGPGKKTVLLSVYLSELERALKKSKGGQALLNLVVQNGKTYTKPAIIKELQTHPVERDILHVDFYEIDMNRKIKVKVPVVTKGKSKGVELGGILQIIRRELEVLCLPLEIPESIEVDISDLDVGDSVHVKSITLKDNIEIPADVDFTVLTIVSPKAVEEAVPEEVEEEEAEAEEAAAEKEVSETEG